MANTRDWGRLYVTRTARLRGPVLTVGWTAEIEEPFRQGRCLVARIPFTEAGVAVGLWGREGSEAQTLSRLGVRDLTPADYETEYSVEDAL